MNTWNDPLFFWLIVPLITVVAWRQFSKLRPGLQFSHLSALKRVSPSLRARMIWLPPALQALSLVLLVFALARPQKANQQVNRNIEGIDIMIALDISDSMLIEDMPPQENRMDSAKTTVEAFIKGRVSDKIGLLVFSGESFTRVPPTLDYPVLIQSVREIQTSRNIKMGTAIGVALANAVARLKDSVAKSKIIVFMTDGENNAGTIDPLTALEIAKGFGIKIYSIGIGRDGETRLPVIQQDPFGNKIKRYQPFSSTVNEELLNKFATETGGKFYRATTGTALQKIFDDINRLEKTKIDEHRFVRYSELFQDWLIAGLIVLTMATGLRLTLFRRGPSC